MLRAVRHTGQALGLTHGQHDAYRIGALVVVGDSWIDVPAAVANHELNGALRGERRQGGVGSPLEALGCLGVQLVPA